MLSYHPGFERSTGALIGVRHSMIKFKSAHRVLEIKKVAQRNTGSSSWGPARTLQSNHNRHHCTLFQQLVFVLSSIGVPDLVFERLQRQYLCRLVTEGCFGKRANEVPRRVLREFEKTPVELLLFQLLLQHAPRAPWPCTACTCPNPGTMQQCKVCDAPAPPRLSPDVSVIAAARSVSELASTASTLQKIKSQLVSVLKFKRHKGHVPCERLVLLQVSPRC